MARSALGSALSLLLVVAPASAEQTKPAEAGRHGFELMLRPAYGAGGAQSPVAYDPTGLVALPQADATYGRKQSPYGGGFAGEAYAGFRFLPYLSAGFHGQFRQYAATSPNDGTQDLSRSAWGAGMYVRGYFPMIHDKLDPWVMTGVGYMQDKQTYTFPVATTIGPMSGDWSLTHYGVEIPLAVGVDYRILPMLALGPSFKYSLVQGAGGCAKASIETPVGADSNSYCSNADSIKRITAAQNYGVWSVGLDVRLTLW